MTLIQFFTELVEFTTKHKYNYVSINATPEGDCQKIATRRLKVLMLNRRL